MTDISIVMELVILVACFFAYKYGLPIVKDIMMSKWAYIIVAAANELNIVGELDNKWDYAMSAMKNKLEKHKITFDEEEVTDYLKAAITKLRINISNTNAEKKIEEK